jgi:hypothetical protein
MGWKRYGNPSDQGAKAYRRRTGGAPDPGRNPFHRASWFPDCTRDLEAPRFLIPVQGLLDIFSFFLLILIGVESLETLKAYVKKDVIHVRLVIEVALIAMARKVIVLEPDHVAGPILFGMAALILALSVAFYFERQSHQEERS